MSGDRAIPAIPFSRVSVAGDETGHLAEAARSGHISGDGPMAGRCETLLAEELRAARVLLTPSATHALELAALLLDLGRGAEVICPSFTHPSTVNAFAMHGARPVFCDIRPDTLNIDEEVAGELAGDRTGGIVCTHYAGVACELDELLAIGARCGAPLVEDNAHGLFGSYRGRPLGTLGRFGALSFHETKNVTSGEGGALLLTRAEDVERAEILREKGTNRGAFFRGEVDAYEWVELGSSYLVSELQAAFLRGQLERSDAIQGARHRIWERYAGELADWARRHGVELPFVPEDRAHPAHLFHLRMPGKRERDGLIEHLSRRGIVAVFHYMPLHLSPMGRRLAPDCPPLPVTERAAERVVRLPLFADLEPGEQSRVIEAVTEYTP
jgi:dTDP-4-amino-4,6-dideoxygalactose transaminase